MTRPVARVSVATFAIAVLVTSQGAGQQVRDAAAQYAPSGTGLLSGTVVTDETPARPLRRATVTLSEIGSAIVSRLATTDDMGEYTFSGLPPGKYTISASRPPYLRGSYGAHRMVSPSTVVVPTTIPLASGQHVTGLTIFMQPGAAISGTVRDAEGQPASGVSINVWYHQWVSGRRTFVSAGASSSTDDRGAYRIYGLAPGEYVLAIVPRGPRQADVMTLSDASAPSQTVGWAPVFYPGTTDVTQASPIRVAIGEDRSGVDLQIRFVVTSRVEGAVIGRDGSPAPGLQVEIISANFDTMPEMGAFQGGRATTDKQGRFVLSGVAPGAYSVQARSYASPPMLFGATDVVVQGQDAKVTVFLLPLPAVTGRVAFEGTGAPPDMSRIRIVVSGSKPPFRVMDAALQANREFSVADVVPDHYRVSATHSASAGAAPWILKSATVNGQDVADRWLEIRPGSVTSLIVTFSDRTTELSGRLSDAANSPVSDFYVVAFPADQAAWTPMTRRIQITRPEQDGRFIFRNLPAGDYRVVAITDVEQGEWLNPEFLTQLIDASIAIALPDGGKVVQDLRVR